MIGEATAPRHWTWMLTNVFVVLSILSYTTTAWGLLRHHSWWTSAAVVSGVLGLLAVGAFLLSQRTLEIGFQDFGVQLNLWLHLVGAILIIVLARLAAVRTWVSELP